MTKEVTAVCRRGRNTLFTLWVRSNLGGGGSCLVPLPGSPPFQGLGRPLWTPAWSGFDIEEW